MNPIACTDEGEVPNWFHARRVARAHRVSFVLHIFQPAEQTNSSAQLGGQKVQKFLWEAEGKTTGRKSALQIDPTNELARDLHSLMTKDSG